MPWLVVLPAVEPEVLPDVLLDVVASGVVVPAVLELPLAVVPVPVAPVAIVAIMDDSYDTSCETGITTMRGWNMPVVLPDVVPAPDVPAPPTPMFMPSKVKIVPESVPLPEVLVLPLVAPAPIKLTEPFCTVTLGMLDPLTSNVMPL